MTRRLPPEQAEIARQKGNRARSLRLWPLQKVERLRFMVEAGVHSFGEIGEIMGITKNSAIGKARRLNIEGLRSIGPKEAVPTTLFSRMDALHAAFDAARVPDPPRIRALKQTDNATRRINWSGA